MIGALHHDQRLCPRSPTRSSSSRSSRRTRSCREKLGQKDLAFITYCRAFREQPQDEEVRAALNTLAGENESWEELSMVYEEVAESARPRGQVACRLAGIQDEHLDEPEAAEASLRRSWSSTPPTAPRWTCSARCTAGAARTPTTSQPGAEAGGSGSIDERKVILREIARVHDERRKDTDSAVGALQRALELDGATIDVLAHHPQAREALAGSHRAAHPRARPRAAPQRARRAAAADRRD